MTQLHINEVLTKGSVYPMIINFQNGYTTDEFKNNECAILENHSTKERTIATELNDLIYSGEETKEDLGKTLILARNKKTGKVRLIEVGCAELKPVIDMDTDATSFVKTSNLELSRKFGSKKQKKIMEQKEKLKINVKAVTEQMQNVTQNITEDQLDLSSYNKSDIDNFYVPPIDRNATKAENVYDIDQILNENQYEKVYSELEDKDYTSDMMQIVKNIATARNMSQKHTVLAVYADTLLKMYKFTARDINKKAFVACPHSATLNKIVLANFCTITNTHRLRPAEYKDKTICHAIVFLLLINNLKVDVDELCQAMKVTHTTVTLKGRVAGATTALINNKKVLHLKLPLASKIMNRRKSTKF